MRNFLKEITFYNFTCFALLWMALFSFLSVSLMSVGHILLFLSASYLFWGEYQKGALFQKIKTLPRSFWFLLLLIVLASVSVLMNWEEIKKPLKNISRTKYMFMGVLSYFPLKKLHEDYMTPERWSKLLNVFLWSFSFATLIGILGKFIDFNLLRWEPPRLSRVGGAFNVMSYAYAAQFVLLGLWGLLLCSKEKRSLWIRDPWLFFHFCVSILGIYFAKTRGAYVGILVGFPVLFYFFRRKWFYKALFIVSIFSFVTVFFVVSGVKESRFRMFNAYNSHSNLQRVSQYQASWFAFKERPFFGNGFRNIKATTKRIKKEYKTVYQDYSSHAHNNFLEFLASSGLFAFFAFLMWHVSWFRDLRSKNTEFSKIALSIFAAFVVSGLFQSTIIDAEVMFMLMLFYPLTYIL